MMKKLALNLLKSADEKLRSLGGKHQSSKTDSHTGQPKSSTLPLTQPQHREQKLIYYPPHDGEPIPQHFYDQHLSAEEQEFQSSMAERKIQRLGKKDRFRNPEGSSDQVLTEDGKIVIKRRSRSEGPQGRIQMPNSSEEPDSSRSTKTHAKSRSNRQSLYTDPLSDDADCAADKENSVTDSDSGDSGPKKWTKNPLHVKRAKKSDRSEKRKSAHSLENGFTLEENTVNFDPESRSPRPSRPSNREAYVYQEKDLQSGQKAKYQKLEERRRKRVDMTVTSDEEFTPASRISQLRQRAIQSANLSVTKDSMEDVSIPASVTEPQNTTQYADTTEYKTQSPFPKQTQSPAQKSRKIIPSDNVSFGVDYKNVMKSEQKPEVPMKPQPGTSEHAQQQSGSRQYPSNQSAGQSSPWSGGYSRSGDGLNKIAQTNGHINDGQLRNSYEEALQKHQNMSDRNSGMGVQDTGLRIRELPQGGRVAYYPGQKMALPNLPKNNVPQYGEINDSDSEMTSFLEIKTNQPVDVKKAVGQFESKHKSFSDEDSLDELIESNIQYLESEIGNKRAKKSNAPRSFPLHDISGVTETDKARGKKTSSLENVSASSKGVSRKDSFYQNYPASAGSSVTQLNRSEEKLEPLKPRFSAYEHAAPLAPQKVERPRPPVTYSPFLYRRSADFTDKEDISKSDPQINKAANEESREKFPQSGYVLPQQTVQREMVSSSSPARNRNLPFQQEHTSVNQTKNSNFPYQQNQGGFYRTKSNDISVPNDQTSFQPTRTRNFPYQQDPTSFSQTKNLNFPYQQDQTGFSQTNNPNFPYQQNQASFSQTKNPILPYQQDQTSFSQNKNPNFPYHQDQTSFSQTKNPIFPYKQDPPVSYQLQNTIDPVQGQQNNDTSVLSVDKGMFSDVDYDIEVSDRVKKWEKFMRKANDNQGLMTIEEGDGSVVAQSRVAPVLHNIAVTSIAVTVNTATAHVPQLSKSAIQSFMEPRVLSKETSLHRVFKVVQDPPVVTQIPIGSRYRESPVGPVPYSAYPSTQQQRAPAVQSRETHIQPYESPRLSRQNLVWKPPSASHTPSNDPVTVSKQNLVWKPPSTNTTVVSDSDLALNSSKQFKPPYESDSGVQKSSRLSRYEDEINELKEITSERFQNLRKRFDSDSDIPQSQAQADVPVVKPLPTNILGRWESGSNTSQSVSEPRSPVKLHSPTKGKDQKIDWVNVKDQQPIKKKFWSPNMESSGQGLVSIERMTARTLQTIPFSEDPIWRELEEMTSGNFEEIPKPAYIQNQLELENVINLLQQHSATSFPEQPMLNQIPPTPPMQRSQPEIERTPQSHQSTSTLTATPQNVQSSPSSEQSGPLKEFTTPKIRPLTLTIGGNSSAKNALDDVLEDIRTSLDKKPASPRSRKASDTISSPGGSSLLTLSPGSQLHGPSSLTRVVENDSVGPIAPIKDFSRQPQPQEVQSLASQPTAVQQSTNNAQSQQKYIDPLFTQYPYIVNGNYQLDPDLLKKRLLDTGLAEHSDREGGIIRNPNYIGSMNVGSQQASSETTVFPKAQDKNSSNPKVQQDKNSSNPKVQSKAKRFSSDRQQKLVRAKTFDDTDQSIEELKQLARDVEKKLTQIKSKIIDSEEDRLDTILLALRKFAPEIDPKIPEPKVSATYSQNVDKKVKLKDALTELERIYESLDLESDVLMSRAERKECMIPQSQEQLDLNQSSRFASGSFPQISPSTSHTQSGVAQKNFTAPELDSKTLTEFDSVSQSFDNTFQNIPSQTRMMVEGNSYHPYWNSQNFTTSVDGTDNQARHLGNAKKKSSSYIILSPPMTPGSVASVESDSNRPALKKTFVTKGCGVDSIQTNISDSCDSYSQSDISHGRVEAQPRVRMRVKHGTQDDQFIHPSEKKNHVERPSATKKAIINEYRKSVPADFSEGLKRTVETQTMESTPTVAEVREKFESDVKNVLSRDMSVSSESSADVKIPRKRKISRGIANLMGIFSSSDEEQSRKSGLKHSHSAPDLCSMFSDKKETDAQPAVSKKSAKVKKIKTPRSVKQRHEARARHKSLQYYHVTSKDSSEQDDITSVTSPTSDESTTQSPQPSGTTKPPLYPLKKSDSKTEMKDSAARKLSSDISNTPKLSSDDAMSSNVVLREKTNDSEKLERPRSFHELLSTFETKPERLAKYQMRLRKCASVDMTDSETVLSKVYHSEPDLRQEPRKRSGSEGKLTLKLQFQWKS